MFLGNPSKSVKLRDVIRELALNYKAKNNSIKTYFSLVDLSFEQQYYLIVPSYFNYLKTNVLIQTNKYNTNGIIIESTMSLMIMVEKDDGYVYGLLYNIVNQKPYTEIQLLCSKYPLLIDNRATFINTNIIESYINIDGRVVSISNANTTTFAKRKKMYINKMANDGLVIDGKLIITGRSSNIINALNKKIIK